MFELWPFQSRLKAEAGAGFRKFQSQCIVSPTGSGKTVLIAAITMQLYNELSSREKCIALYLVHRKELIDQTVNTLVEAGFRLGTEVGVIAAGHPVTPWAPLQVASIATIVRRLVPDNKLPWLDPRIVVPDEAHHVAAETWAQVFAKFPNAYKLGLTATPARLDGKGLKRFFQNLVIGPQILDITPDFLCPTLTYSIPPLVDLKGLSIKAAGAAMSGPVIADAIGNWQRLAGDRRTIFFCVNTKHSMDTVAKLQELGISAEHLDFKTPGSRRKAVLKSFREGGTQCISNVELFTEGMDAKACNCVVVARNTKSFTLWRQMNGRSMRKKPPGEDAIVIDAGGNVHGNGHGAADADVEWSLEYGVDPESKAKVATTHRRCEACGHEYLKKFDNCPLCGAAPLRSEITEVNANVELVKGGGRRGNAAKPTKRQLSAEILETEGDLGKLRDLRRKYGFHSKWPTRMQKIYFPAVHGMKFF